MRELEIDKFDTSNYKDLNFVPNDSEINSKIDRQFHFWSHNQLQKTNVIKEKSGFQNGKVPVLNPFLNKGGKQDDSYDGSRTPKTITRA